MKCMQDLTFSQASGKAVTSVDKWYNAVQAQVNLAKYPPETAKILHGDIFLFFLQDEEFVSRTIHDGSVDLDKFPASRVRQLAKRLESSKATACHIKQVAGDPQAAKSNLLRHQCTELPSGKNKKKRPPVKQKQSNHKQQSSENYQVQAQHKKRFHPKSTHNNEDRCSKCGDTAHIEGFQCPAKIPMQSLPQVWTFYKHVFPEKSKLTSNPEDPKHISTSRCSLCERKCLI